MKPETSPRSNRIVKTVYFGNWGDIWGYPLAQKLVPFTMPFGFITPNFISITGFLLFTLGSLLLFIEFPYHLLISAIFLPLGFLLDDLDGQVARAKKLGSELGNYLDKVLDVLKIFILNASLSYAVYLQTNNILSIYLGFIACFFFMYRYYIKLETVLRQAQLDNKYLEKSSEIMDKVEENIFESHKKLWSQPLGKLQVLWEVNRTIFFVDEAEFAVFTAVGALFNRLDIALWTLAISQVLLCVWRLIERGHQTVTKSERLYYFMRK